MILSMFIPWELQHYGMVRSGRVPVSTVGVYMGIRGIDLLMFGKHVGMIHVAGLHVWDLHRYKHQLQKAARPVTLYARVRRRKGITW